MSLLTDFRAPGSGRRQARREDRLAADNARLRRLLSGAEALIEGLRVQLADRDQELTDEKTAHADARRRLEIAIRANRCNSEAETVTTDVTALRAAVADQYVDPEPAGPQYAPYRRIVGRTVTVMPLWASPQAAGPTNIPLAVAS